MALPTLPTVTLPDGRVLPALGLGTWRLGEDPARRRAEVALLRAALDAGCRVVDTAEMYGDGGAEAVLGQALAEAFRAGLARDEVFVVSKVLPHHADDAGTVAACDASRRRLGLDTIDLYLLHWRGGVPPAQTLRGFEALRARGAIARHGVSNFDLDDLQAWTAMPGGAACAANQVWYSLGQRGVEHALLPWMRRHGMPLMAYGPLDEGALARHRGLAALAAPLGASAAQLALAWLLAQPGVIALPKAARETHLRDNLAAAALALDDATRQGLDRLFPPPRRAQPLAMY